MSVRRLDPVQPASFAFTAENLAWAKKLIGNYPLGKQASAVIPLLWRAQEQNDNWVSRPAIEYVAGMLEMSFIRVLEVATFYTMFQLSPVGKRAHIQLCGTTPCMLRGAEDLKTVCRSMIHREPHHLSADGNFSWEEVECLGACVNAPMVQIFSDTYEDLTPASFEQLISDLAAGKPVKPGPQIKRQLSAPEGGATTLTDPAIYANGPSLLRREPGPATPPAVATKEPSDVVQMPASAMDLTNSAQSTGIGDKPKSKPVRTNIPEFASDGAPALLLSPINGKSDDLKLVWGIGQVIEKILNNMGIWHFDQMASWTASELNWVDSRIGFFKGRARRDDWIEQAKKLAAGWRPVESTGDKPAKIEKP